MDAGFMSGAAAGNPMMKTGSGTGTGNGVTTTFTMAHGLGSVPSFAVAVATNALAAGDKVTSMDATNITVTFNVAPTAGALTFKWLAVA